MKKIILIYFTAIIFQTIVFIYYYKLSFPSDDAYISFRYADNLSTGYGWVYNKGELTSGTTSFINTILISAIALMSKLSTEFIGRLLPLFFSFLNIYFFVFILFRLTSSTPIVILFILLFTLNPFTYETIFSGMETNLFIFVTLVIFYLIFNNKILAACLLSVMLPFIRPEGALLIAILLIYIVINRKNINHFIICLIPLTLSIPLYLTINFIFFGIPIPLSMYAKYISYSDTMLVQNRYQLLKNFFGGKWALFFVPALVLSIIYFIKFKLKISYIYFFTFGYILIYLIFNPWMRPWYYAVMLPFLIFLSCIGIFYFSIAVMSNNIYFKLSGTNKHFITVIFLVVLFLLFSINLFLKLNNDSENNSEGFYKSVYSIGNYLSGIENIQNKKIYTGDIGYIGYKSNGIIIDYAGLVYPESLQYSKYRYDYEEGRSIDWIKQIEFIKKENPDFIVNDKIYPFYKKMKEDKYLLENYSLVYSIGTMEVLRKNNI